MDAHVRSEVQGGIGLLVLHRPEKINAITPAMVDTLGATLRAWRYDASVYAVVLRGEGERGFSAGADLSGSYAALSNGEEGAFLETLAAESELAALIGSYPKPVVAIMHGLTLGAGLGLAGQASVRIVTPDSRLGMPEARIGYVPDVGGSLLLGRAPGRAGEHLAATGDTVGAADAVELGLAEFCMDPDGLDDVLATLSDLAQLGAGEIAVGLEVLHGIAPPRTTAAVSSSMAWIDHCYAAPELADILVELESSPWPAAQAAAERIRQNSPLAAATAIEVVRAARDEDELRGALQREHRAAAVLLEYPDLLEGIRARIIDKDDAPAWNPEHPEDVDYAIIERVLELEDDEDW